MRLLRPEAAAWDKSAYVELRRLKSGASKGSNGLPLLSTKFRRQYGSYQATYLYVCSRLMCTNTSLVPSYGFHPQRAIIKGNPIANQFKQDLGGNGLESGLTFVRQSALGDVSLNFSLLKRRQCGFRYGIAGDCLRPTLLTKTPKKTILSIPVSCRGTVA